MNAWGLTKLSKTFSRGSWLNPDPFLAINKVDFHVAPGERVALIGQSGSGKSTAARVGMGLLKPDSGSIEILGQDATHWSASQWHGARRQVQLLFQDPRAMLNPARTLGQLLAEGVALHQPGADVGRTVSESLDRVGLGGRELAFPRELSGGERRRAGVARVLLARPKLLVADEPTAGLDAALKADLIELLFELLPSDCAVVLISHDMALVNWATSRIAVMYRGQVVDNFNTSDMGKIEHHPHTTALLQAAGVV